MLTNSLGQAFVKFYYRHSPPIADVIRKHASLKYATRLALFPLIYSVEYPYLMAVLLHNPGRYWISIQKKEENTAISLEKASEDGR